MSIKCKIICLIVGKSCATISVIIKGDNISAGEGFCGITNKPFYTIIYIACRNKRKVTFFK